MVFDSYVYTGVGDIVSNQFS